MKFLLVLYLYCQYCLIITTFTACQYSLCLCKLMEYPKYHSRLLLSPVMRGLIHSSGINKFPMIVSDCVSNWKQGPSAQSHSPSQPQYLVTLWEVPLKRNSVNGKLSSFGRWKLRSAWSQDSAISFRTLQASVLCESQLLLFPVISQKKGFERLQNELQNMPGPICPKTVCLKEDEIKEESYHQNGVV